MGLFQNKFYHGIPQAQETEQEPSQQYDDKGNSGARFNEGQHQLSNFSEANKTLEESVKECNKKIIDLEKTLKDLDKKNNQMNQQKYGNKNPNADNRMPNPPVMYCHLCGHNNDTLNVRMNFFNPKTG